MDNQTVDIVSEGAAGIGHVLAAIWPAAAAGGKATHYKIGKYREEIRYCCRDKDGVHYGNHYTNLIQDPEKGRDTMILLWHEEGKDCVKLPFPLAADKAAMFIADWLESLVYGRQPDHDGDNGKGWRLFTEGWGHVAGNHYAIIAAQPAWAMYGK